MLTTTTTDANQVMAKVGDAKSLMSYSHYLVMKAQLTGNLCFDGHRPTEEEIRIAEKCRMMCVKISRSLDVCEVNEIPDLLDYYDMVYRIGNKRLPDSTFIRRHKQRVFKAWKTGDRKIEESSVYGMIIPEVSFRPEKADREYFTAYLSIKEKWIATLKRYGSFPGVASYENFQRLALMMRENLGRELGDNSERARLKWYERNRIGDFSAAGSLLLRSYRHFTSSLYPKVLDHKTQLSLDNRILSELSTRTDLNPYDREAFRLALKHNKQLVNKILNQG